MKTLILFATLTLVGATLVQTLPKKSEVGGIAPIETKVGESIAGPVVSPEVQQQGTKTAMLAGGCFWCVESDLEKLPGVITVVSGYAGGTGEGPDYTNYSGRGFREVVLVTYDPTKVIFGNLVDFELRHSDPTDTGGSFYDRGGSYTSAVYYMTEGEKNEALRVIRETDAKKVFTKPIVTQILPYVKFWPAEEYHQDYAKKNPTKYAYYRFGSGRDAFIKKHWGDNLIPSPLGPEKKIKNNTQQIMQKKTWDDFVKPQETELRAKLTPIQYQVTQEEGTESPFKNEYDTNYAEGIYVDIVSGEPLYSSRDKFDSGTGWPSFVKPIAPDAVKEVTDNRLFFSRTEVRSKIADSHLGHVFNDGPSDRGGLRYCMNSAALRFVSKDKMVEEGYGEYLAFLD